jgi:hypothetical protein
MMQCHPPINRMLRVYNIDLVYQRLQEELVRLHDELRRIDAKMLKLDRLGKAGYIHPFDVDLRMGELYLEASTHRTNIHLLCMALYELEQAAAQLAADGRMPWGVT